MTLPQLPGFESATAAAANLSDDDWFHKWIEISTYFTPTSPVKETELFSGRSDQIRRIVDGVFQTGQHIVIYGDRGVGKTSLLNITSTKLFVSAKSVKVFRAQCYAGDDFMKIWERVLDGHVWENGDHAYDDIDSTLDPDGVFKIVSRFGAATWPVFVFDEFDRITDALTKTKVAETIKLLSDRSTETTILIAGVGRTIRDLIAEHESVKRAIRQIEMPRMSPDEVRELFNVRLNRVGMTVDPLMLDGFMRLARGMPAFAHLLGRYAARAAIDDKTLHIGMDQFMRSLDYSLEEAGESIRQSYAVATQSPQPNNLLRQALLACAISAQDEWGAFAAADVREPFSRILNQERDIPDFNRHINAFTTEERGPILEREGTPRKYRYRFIDPMMQCYVMTRGVRDRLLPIPT